MTTLRYWASARSAAGVASEQVDAGTLAVALGQVGAGRERLARVLEVCSYVVDGDPVGTRPHDTVDLSQAQLVDVLPPFAGG